MDTPFSPCNSSTPHFHQSFFPNNNNLYKPQQNNNNNNNHGDGGVAGPRKKSSSSSSSSSSGKSAKLSTDRQSVAARERRHRISDRFKILQSLVPGGSKMDTVSMLEGAIDYVNFLKAQIWLHETMINSMAGPNDVVDNGLLIGSIDCPYYYDASNDYSQILGDEWLQVNNAGVAPPYPPSQLEFVEGGAPVQGEETMYSDEFVYY